jgi:xanthine dehydrogenase accessory factor
MDFDSFSQQIVLVRGGGDLASGVVLRLYRAGFQVIVSELAHPLVVRRKASFAQAVFAGTYQLEEVTAERVERPEQIRAVLNSGKVAVIVDPGMELRRTIPLLAIVDARMTKCAPDLGLEAAPIVIGLGPGFEAGVNCTAVIETNRGPFLGRVYWQGSAEPNTGIPESVRGFNVERVLYAPCEGVLTARREIGDIVEENEIIAAVGGEPVRAKFKGLLRGLIQSGLTVTKGLKIGDLDPRCDDRYYALASDKALAIGGGVVEALLLAWRRRGMK